MEEISGPTGQNWSEISYMDLFLRSSRWVIFLGYSVQSNTFRKRIVNRTPIAQMADIGFKVVLLERLNQKWKQKHF